jgi:hypothetical protein
MVLQTISQNLNQWLGPWLLRNGLTFRYVLSRPGGVLTDNPTLDALCGISWAQKLISIEAHHEGNRKVLNNNNNNNNTTNTEKDLETASSIRLRVLESYLRPALVPNERFSDIRRFQFHFRFVAWARSEFLVTKYRDSLKRIMISNPSIANSPQLEPTMNKTPFRLFDTETTTSTKSLLSRLPTSAQVKRFMEMEGWSENKNLSATHIPMTQLVTTKLGGEMICNTPRFCCAYVENDDHVDTSKLSLEEIIEVAGGHVIACGPLNALCEDSGIFQFWTRDYVESLGRYLWQRAQQKQQRSTIILDVGSGDGLLAQLLRDYFEQRRDASVMLESRTRSRKAQSQRQKRFPTNQSHNVSPTTAAVHSLPSVPSVVATDDGSWRIGEKAPVERWNVEDALAQYCYQYPEDGQSPPIQTIVLCSWMPMNEDWSALFRSSKVDEYILIGECDDGQCGDSWETWGNTSVLDEEISVENVSTSSLASTNQGHHATKNDDPIPPYCVDNYERVDMNELGKHQFSRFDCRYSKSGRTVSFRRMVT